MKLIIGGSTGFVGSEIIRQAASNPAITSIVGLSRREAPEAPETGSTPLRMLVCEDFESYNESIKKELEDADLCIWTIAITPSKLQTVPYEETCKICLNYTVTAIDTLLAVRKKQDRPLRFVYVSGHFARRDPAHVPEQITKLGETMVKYSLLRGEAESYVLRVAEKSEGKVESCIVRPGMIDDPSKPARSYPGVPHVQRRDMVAAILDQLVNGFEKDTLWSDDMVRIGQRALAGQLEA